jgi:predicted metalloprotease
MRLPIGKKSGGGLTGILVIVGITLLLGGDLGSVLGQVSGGEGQPVSYAPASASGGATGVRQTGQAQQDELAEFVAVVLGDTEDTWHKIFKSEGATYR